MLNFLKSLDKDLRQALLTQLRNLWTHASTSIEGNTLTLGETAFVLEEGLTISGKPLKDHQEVVGHARAIDLLYEIIEKNKPFGKEELFALHKAVQTEVVMDVYKPIGGWKVEPNSSVGVVGGKQVIFDYGVPAEIPQLMQNWFTLYEDLSRKVLSGSAEQALAAYIQLHISFVHIHPFFDGNGRMARLVANIPVLKAGLPPVIIPRELRKEYIDILAAYHFTKGQVQAGDPLISELDSLQDFTLFCKEAWQESLILVDEAKKQQARRGVDGKR